MRCGFRPHDHDLMTESMEGLWMGSWAVVKGCWAAKRRGFSGYAVNRWAIKRPPNGTKFDGRSVGAIPRPLGKPRAIPRKFNTRSQKERRRGRRMT